MGSFGGDVPVFAGEPIRCVGSPNGDDMFQRFDEHFVTVGVQSAEYLGVGG